MNNHYNNQLKTYASELRTETVSRAEKYLWKAGLSRKIKNRHVKNVYTS